MNKPMNLDESSLNAPEVAADIQESLFLVKHKEEIHNGYLDTIKNLTKDDLSVMIEKKFGMGRAKNDSILWKDRESINKNDFGYSAIVQASLHAIYPDENFLIDGKYGPKTRAMVLRFMKDYNVPHNSNDQGRAGPGVFAKINELFTFRVTEEYEEGFSVTKDETALGQGPINLENSLESIRNLTPTEFQKRVLRKIDEGTYKTKKQSTDVVTYTLPAKPNKRPERKEKTISCSVYYYDEIGDAERAIWINEKGQVHKIQYGMFRSGSLKKGTETFFLQDGSANVSYGTFGFSYVNPFAERAQINQSFIGPDENVEEKLAALMNTSGDIGEYASFFDDDKWMLSDVRE